MIYITLTLSKKNIYIPHHQSIQIISSLYKFGFSLKFLEFLNLVYWVRKYHNIVSQRFEAAVCDSSPVSSSAVDDVFLLLVELLGLKINIKLRVKGHQLRYKWQHFQYRLYQLISITGVFSHPGQSFPQ